MKKLVTTDIITGVGYPPSKKGFDFLYTSNQEIFKALGQALSGKPVTGTEAYALFGCIETDLGAGNFSYSEGWIYDAVTQEIYYFPAVASIAIATAPILNLDTTASVKYPVAYNPVLFTNNTSKNVHLNNQFVLSNGTLGSGMINFDDLIYINKGWTSYTPTLAGYTSGDVLVVGGVATSALSCSYQYNNQTRTLSLYIYVGDIDILATVRYITISLPTFTGLPTSWQASGVGAVSMQLSAGGSGVIAVSTIELNSSGSGNALQVRKMDDTDFGALTNYTMKTSIDIAFR